MKKIKIIALLLVSLVGFNSCINDDSELTYIAQAPGEFNFSNTFLSEYILTPSTSGNLGERFTWNSADFGVETNINYELQKSIIGDFSDMEIVGSTVENSYSITIGDMLGYANEAGLDNDPSTPEPDNGDIYFRLLASVGTNSTTEVYSSISALHLVIPENMSGPVCDLDQLWAVGAGLPDAGWGWTTPIQFLCTGEGVYTGTANLLNGESFRFFTVEGDWASGQNYPYFLGEGYTIDANFEDAMDGDNNFRFIGTSGSYSFTIDTVGKIISIE